MWAPLLLAAIAPQGVSTPTDFLVRVHGIAVSEDGLAWHDVGAPVSSTLVDLVGEPAHELGSGPVPVGVYRQVRVELGTVMQFEGTHPCTGGTVFDMVDWSGDPQIDPDEDGRWQLHFALESEGGGPESGGSATDPLLLEQPIVVGEGQATDLRLVLGVSGALSCDQGELTVKRPHAHLSGLQGSSTDELAGSTWQVTAATLRGEGESVGFSTHKAELTFEGDGRWHASLVQWRDLDLGTGETDFGSTSWSGWWTSTSDGGLWLAPAGLPTPLTGWVRADNGAFSLASTGMGPEALILWGLKKGGPAPQHPFTSPHRVMVHDVDLNLQSNDPLVADLATWRLFGRFVGDINLVHFDETAHRNRMQREGWIGAPTEGPPLVDIDWLPLHQGMNYSVPQGSSVLGLTILDLGAYYDGWLTSDANVAIFDRRDLPAYRMGLGVSVRLGGGLSNNSLQGRSFKGAFFEDRVDELEHGYSTGRMEVTFTSGIACVVQTVHTRKGERVEANSPGTFECWGEGRVVLNLADGRRFEGQVDPLRGTLGLCSSEIGVQGQEDRLIAFLVKP